MVIMMGCRLVLVIGFWLLKVAIFMTKSPKRYACSSTKWLWKNNSAKAKPGGTGHDSGKAESNRVPGIKLGESLAKKELPAS